MVASAFRRFSIRYGQLHPEVRALLIIVAHLAIHQRGQLPGNGQAKTGAGSSQIRAGTNLVSLGGE
ncbi:hypothetical protein NLK58_11755 [Marinobacter metalliresistant]|uniref:Uncharacterized protein n=1 Tax=Marinobacter metalliresistant TaxID=2961995 RepID=A0ABZ2VX40_9GAMM|nr:hypothetical protein [Marinobacter sp. Arc7-DN-1]